MKNRKQLSKEAFDKQAKTYDKDMKGNHARKLYPHILQQIILTYGENILDVGCGSGELMLQVLEEDHSRKIIGIDLSEEMISVAKNKLGQRADCILADAENLPFEDECFDIVYCNDSFHHYPQPMKALEEMNRVLKTGGTIIIGDCYLKGLKRQIINRLMRFSHEGDIKIYSESEMKEMMSEYFHGFHFQNIHNQAFIMKGKK